MDARRTEERTMMNRTRRTVGVAAFATLVVLGTGWTLEKELSSSHAKSGAPLSEPARASDEDTWDVRSAATDSGPEYDRSDLLLSQG
jgi:hypothetical protein